MVNHNHSQCLALFLTQHAYSLLNTAGTTESRTAMLKQVIQIAAKAGYVESLEVLLLAVKAHYSKNGFRWACEQAYETAIENNEQKCLDLSIKMQGDLNLSHSYNKRKRDEENGEASCKKQKPSLFWSFVESIQQYGNNQKPDEDDNTNQSNSNNSFCTLS